MPKLTDEELKHIAKNYNLETHSLRSYKKRMESETKESEDKYLHAQCFRLTTLLTLDSNLTSSKEKISDDSAEISSDEAIATSSEDLNKSFL